MSNKLHKVQRDGRNAGMIPGRTFERAQGCWNCVNFVTGEPVRAYYKAVCLPRDHGAAKSYEALGQDQAAKEMKALMNLARQAINSGGLGMCNKGKGAPDKNGKPSDFIAHNYLCADGWSGVQGASVAREGRALDKTPEELKDIVDGSDGGVSAAEEAASGSGLILK